jgi:hypothetical protein
VSGWRPVLDAVGSCACFGLRIPYDMYPSLLNDLLLPYPPLTWASRGLGSCYIFRVNNRFRHFSDRTTCAFGMVWII